MSNSPLVIGLCGKARAGKDTFAALLSQELMKHDQYPFVMALASPLKAMLMPLLDVFIHVESAHAREAVLTALIEGDNKEDIIPGLGVSPRRLMQTLGTDWGRDMISRSMWTDAAKIRIARAGTKGATFAILTDVRFDDEAALTDLLFRVERGDAPEVATHSSENGISEFLVTDTIKNDGTQEELAERAAELIKDIIGSEWEEEGSADATP